MESRPMIAPYSIIRIPITLGRELFGPIITAGWSKAPAGASAGAAFGVPLKVVSWESPPPSSSIARRIYLDT